MQPKTLELAPKEKVMDNHDLLMGYSMKKNSEYVRVFDNWVNRSVLGYPLRMRELDHEITNARQKETMEKLFPFQVADVHAMAAHDYYLNRNRMGAGKTIEMIATCILLDAQSILIVCPKTLQTQWVAQFKAWFPERANDVKAYSFKHEPKPSDILVVNPEKLISSKSKGKFNKFVWDVMCIDEAHIIKNRGTQRSKAVKTIPAKHRYAMTGTPVLKSPDDLFSIFEFLNPEIAGASYWRFVEYFCKIREDFYGRHIEGLTDNEQHIDILKGILDKLSCYNAISVGQSKRVIHVPLEMEDKQRKLYSSILKIELENLPENITIPNGAVKTTRLLQTTSCPAVFRVEDGKEYPWGVKFEYIKESLDNNPDMKLVVYSKYATVINLLKEYLGSKRITVATYTGQQSLSVRNEAKNAFVKDSSVRVLAGTIDALGTGVDGLQEVCHVCVFIDRDVRPTINEQCEARLHRTGQTEEVLCYYLECEKSIDKHVNKLNAIRSEDLRKLMEDV